MADYKLREVRNDGSLSQDIEIPYKTRGSLIRYISDIVNRYEYDRYGINSRFKGRQYILYMRGSNGRYSIYRTFFANGPYIWNWMVLDRNGKRIDF